MRDIAPQNCANCEQATKVRHRDISDQVWTLLLNWREVEESTINQPICDTCYQELRELLIERSDEMERVFSGQEPIQKINPTEIKHVTKKKKDKPIPETKKSRKAS